jgi:hypothetical protein
MGEHHCKSLENVSRRTIRRLGSGAFALLVTYAVAGLTFVLSSPATAQPAPVTFCDSDLPINTWALQVFSCPVGTPPNTVTATHEVAGGSGLLPLPGTCTQNKTYRNVANILNTAGTGGGCPGESTVYGVHTFSPQSYNPATSGAVGSIDFQIDYECPDSVVAASCVASGQAFGPALLQNGHYFVANAAGTATGVTGVTGALVWKRFSSSSLVAADFSEITQSGSGAGAVIIIDATTHPDFRATANPIRCGFYTGNATSGPAYTINAGYDNWACTITPTVLKVCKVAGPGIVVGTSFGFTANGNSFQVPAGPAPGGTCVVVSPGFPVGTLVHVAETPIPNVAVSNITVMVTPPTNAGIPDLPNGTVDVTIGSGVTEVTYTDYNKNTGYLEICKSGVGSGSFTVNPGGLGPFVVATGTCSPAIQVSAGTVKITENSTANGVAMSVCTTIPSSRQQGPCNVNTQTSTVTVVPGDVTTQTTAFIKNIQVPPKNNPL